MARECAKPVQGYWRPDPENPGKDKWVELHTAFSCSVLIPDGQDTHEGPHAARESQTTLVARQRWFDSKMRGVLGGQKTPYTPPLAIDGLQARPVTFAEGHAMPGTSMPHPSAPVDCPFGCGERPMAKDLSRHLGEHNLMDTLGVPSPPTPTEQPGGYLLEKAKRGNPYYQGSRHDLTVGPPSSWLGHVAPGAEKWPLGIEEPPQAPEPVIHAAPSPNSGFDAVLEAQGYYPEETEENIVPTRANREHDQALPQKNEYESIQDTVIREIERRKAIGLQRYGSLLQPDNGRDALRDASEEALDLLMYLTQYQQERAIYANYFNQVLALINRLGAEHVEESDLEALRKLNAWFYKDVQVS